MRAITKAISTLKYLLLLVSAQLFAQLETNYWHFGVKAGVDFTTGTPIAIANSQLTDPSGSEGCSSISDASGNLLFYTNGVNVWNKNNLVMPNGGSLLGNGSCTQSCIIVPKPGSNDIFYVFTNGANSNNINTNGLNFSIVDMTLNGGLGDVTIKNVNLLGKDKTTEKLTAVKHCNGRDYWVVTHEVSNNTFDAFLVTSVGVSMVPVKSNIGWVHTTNEKLGYMKISPDGKKLALAIYGRHVELFDFDNSTGVVSNLSRLYAVNNANNSYYGLEFSPDFSKLYVTTFGYFLGGWGELFQFNLNAGSTAAINASATLISNPSFYVGAVQLGKDGKIYLVKPLSTFLGVINNPNNLGAACSYVNNAVSLAGNMGNLGLPNFMQSWFYTPPAHIPTRFTFNDTCFSSTTFFSIVDTSKIKSVFWNFNDPFSTNDTSSSLFPKYVFSSAGSYKVELIINYKCISDTLYQTLNILPLPIVNAGRDTVVCNLPTVLNATLLSGKNYSWIPTVGLSCPSCAITNAFPGGTTNYKVFVTNNNGCIGSDSVLITVSCPVVTLSGGAICKGNCFTLSATPAGGLMPYTFDWSNGITSSTNLVCPLVTTVYSVTLTDANGATSVATTSVIVLSDVTASIASVDNKCNGEANGSVTINPLTGTNPFAYSWNTGVTGINSISGLQSGNYQVVVTDSNGCSVIIAGVIKDPPKLSVNINGKSSVCAGSPLSLSAVGAGGTSPYLFSWTPGANVGSLIVVKPDSTVIYSVIATDANGCTADTTFKVIVNPLPLIKYSIGDTEGCAPLCVDFSNLSNSVSCIWDIGDGNFCTSSNFQKCYLTAGNYPVSLTITDANGCTNAVAAATIKVFPVPTATFMASTSEATILSPVIAFANNSIGASSFIWDFGDGDSSTSILTKIQHIYEDTSTYNVSLVAMNEFGCKDTARMKIHIKQDYVMYIPNAFTPNGDGINDLFLPVTYYKEIETVNLYIFDRWGNLIFETDKLDKGWDGKANEGKYAAQEDVYIWKMNVQLMDGKKYKYEGHVSVIK